MAGGGPSDLTQVGKQIYAVSYARIHVVDLSINQIVDTINLSTSDHEKGCFDAGHNMYMVMSRGSGGDVATFVDTSTRREVATVKFRDISGKSNLSLFIGQCRYDSASDTFFVVHNRTTEDLSWRRSTPVAASSLNTTQVPLDGVRQDVC